MTEQERPNIGNNNNEEGDEQSRIKLKKLSVNKETVKELTDDETQQVRGGASTEPYVSRAATDPPTIPV